VVLDNLNTHTPAALYKAFEPREARRILGKLEFHYTPKHGSWLNQVEVEFSVLCRECIGGRRIPDQGTLEKEAGAWERDRNERGRRWIGALVWKMPGRNWSVFIQRNHSGEVLVLRSSNTVRKKTPPVPRRFGRTTPHPRPGFPV
jgi:hypothetical protein